jgi:hypothetical protein
VAFVAAGQFFHGGKGVQTPDHTDGNEQQSKNKEKEHNFGKAA